jgi:hypothetical protein
VLVLAAIDETNFVGIWNVITIFHFNICQIKL